MGMNSGILNNQMMPQMMNQMNVNQNMMNNQMMSQMMNQNMMVNQMANLANNSQMMQMSNQQQQNNAFNSQQNQGINNGAQNQIGLTFIKNNVEAYQKKLKIYCLDSDKVNDVIKKYRVKAEDHNQNENFVFNAKNLNPELTVAESGLQNESIIFVLNKEGVEGGKN